MFNFDFNQPGPSRHSYPNNFSYYGDYPNRNTNASGSTAADRPRESHRGARNNTHNSNFKPNANMMYYPNNQWTPTENQKRQQGTSTNYYNNQPKDKRRDYKDKTHRPQNQHNKKNKDNNAQEDCPRTSIISKEIDFKIYKCPGCSLQFDCTNRMNSYVGRVPLILNCKHTVCQECIPKITKDNTILCPLCKKPSVLPPRFSADNLQDIFFPNFFLIGFIMWCKSQGTNSKFMSLVPAREKNIALQSKSSGQSDATVESSTETCCFLSCNRIATLSCQDCSDIYCPECCTAVHKSAKSLWAHKQVPLVTKKGKETLELEKCSEHSMDVEFYCNDCQIEACCYCFLENHQGHTKENLAKLNDDEMQQLQQNKEHSKKLLKQLLISQKQLTELYACSTSNIEKKVSNYFMNIHAKLQCIEKSIKKEINNYSTQETIIPDIDDLAATLTKSVEKLTNIVIACDALEVKKMNLKEILKRMKDVQNLPSYLLSDSSKGLEPLEFYADPIVDTLEEFFCVKRCENYNFKLVTEEDLPSDYKKDSSDLQSESDIESRIASLSKHSVIEEPKKKVNYKQNFGAQTPLENEMVEVTHIDSLEHFYVQLKKAQYPFSQMNSDINDYIKMGAPTVDHPQLNELYLVMYTTNTKKNWCRGRVTEIKNGEMEPMYEIFFIDYGSTQTVDVSKLRQITPTLAHKRPFAIHCELYNPSMVRWSKNAHVYMGKMINGKQVSMLVKRIHKGVHEVDLMVLSSDRGQTSIIDILIHTCANPLSASSDNESISSMKVSFNQGYKIYGNSIEFRKFQQEKIILVNVIDPHHIFVHVASYNESLGKMNNKLRQTYKASKKNTCLPIEGTYVVVNYKDRIKGNWHRGLVKKVDIAGENCHVLLVDWGLNIVVPWSSIRMMQEQFTRLESQAILVKMAHVEPVNKGTMWLEGATSLLLKYYNSQEVVKMIVHNVDPLEVALFEIVGDVDYCINAQLVVDHLAESTGKISQTLEWPRNDKEVESFNEDDDFVATLLRKIDAMDDDMDEEEDKDVVKQKIEVVKFVSPDLIFIKFSMHESQEMNLSRDLQIHYSNSKERKTKKSWETNELCVVLHNLSYARAKVLEKLDNGRYKVNVYDRAAEVVLPLEKIFEFDKYFNKFPNVVFKSHLANIKPAGGDKWSLASTEALQKIFDKFKDIYGTRVQGDITGKSIPMHMWYAQIKCGGALEASTTKFVSINMLLVRLGFAYRLAVSDTVESVDSVKSTPESSKSKDSAKGESSRLLEAIEKLALKDDANSTTAKSQNEETTELKKQDSSSSILVVEDEASVSVKKTKNITKTPHTLIDWNELIEEEEQRIKKSKMDKSEGGSPYHTLETEIEDWIPAFPIKETEFCAWITCAETGGILYLREEKLQNVYKEMEQNIKEYFDKKPPSPTKHTWQPGQLCTIHYKDYYYRGKVYKVDGPEDITVVMIDFGSDHKLTANDLSREILYPKIPAFASKVKLDRVYAKSGAWLDSDYQTFLDLVSEYSKIIIKSSLDEEIPTAEVFTDKLNVNQTLVRMCPNLTRVELNGDEKSDDDDVVIEEETIVKDGDLITEVSRSGGSLDSTEHVDPEPEQEEAASDVDTTKYTYSLLEFPDSDSKEKLPVSIMSVLEYNKVALKETRTLTDEFYKLGEKIQKGVKAQPVIQHLEQGTPCVCPFSEDGAWYRARVYNVEFADCGFVQVFFVDFGNVESVSVNDIKMMRPEWFDFSVSCHIADVNIELNSDKSAPYVTQHMKKLYGKHKLASIICKDPLCVDLYELDGKLCYESLIEKGLIKSK